MTVIYGGLILIAIAIGTIYIAFLPRAARRRGGHGDSGGVGTVDSNDGGSGDGGGDGGGGD